ncbi:hypothetical protein NDU88_003722 [Pleurodeles waltl]|uniref:Uncharacterized protein n=1 Tax=Pleurodeles waltl TaxID=8319 RepID=A0AAV7UZ89_PLEWA|nr:hypothetical protein NDU88_003722 [Pleurodeles waltl]
MTESGLWKPEIFCALESEGGWTLLGSLRAPTELAVGSPAAETAPPVERGRKRQASLAATRGESLPKELCMPPGWPWQSVPQGGWGRQNQQNALRCKAPHRDQCGARLTPHTMSHGKYKDTRGGNGGRV